MTVKTQPVGPTQQCVVSAGSGLVVQANVTTVRVACTTVPFFVGGSLSGLASGQSVTLTNGADSVTLLSDGPFSFPMKTPSGGSYSAAVSVNPSAPLSQTCLVTAGSGQVMNADVTSISVVCSTNSFFVTGFVTGLAANDTLPLVLNGSSTLAIVGDGGSAIAYGFPTPLLSGTAWTLGVASQPTSPISQTCAPVSDAGVIGATDADAGVSCTTNPFALAVNVVGLGTSSVVLTRGAQDLTASTNGAHSFGVFPSGTAYTVTVKTQPSDRSCTVNSGVGTIGNGPTSISVNCSTLHTIGGTVTGLAGTGLVLRNNGGDDLALSADGSFTFSTPLAPSASYGVTVAANPSSPAQTCTVSNAAGVVGAGDVTNVSVTCTTNTYTVGGVVSGLSGGSAVIRLNGGSNLTLSMNGNFVFTTALASGTAYSVSRLSDPLSPSQLCTVNNGTGMVTNANITNVTVTCVNTYTVGGTVTGLFGTGLVLKNNGGNDLTVNASGAFTFSTKVAFGAPYAVTVATQPGDYVQTCSVSSGSGVMGSANVTTVNVTCGPVTSVRLTRTLVGTARNIPDGIDATCSPTTVPGTALTLNFVIPADHFVVRRVVVTLNNLSHTYLGDLTAAVTHIPPGNSSGDVTQLFTRVGQDFNTRPCGSAARFAGNYTFSDSAGTNLWSYAFTSTTTIPSGTLIPSTTAGAFNYFATTPPASNFNGDLLSGTWRITLMDWQLNDVGSLDGATIQLFSTP